MHTTTTTTLFSLVELIESRARPQSAAHRLQVFYHPNGKISIKNRWNGKVGKGREYEGGGNVPIFELLFDVPSLSFSPFLTLFLYLSLGDMIRDPSRDVYPYPRDNGTALLDALRKFAAPNCVF